MSTRDPENVVGQHPRPGRDPRTDQPIEEETMTESSEGREMGAAGAIPGAMKTRTIRIPEEVPAGAGHRLVVFCGGNLLTPTIPDVATGDYELEGYDLVLLGNWATDKAAAANLTLLTPSGRRYVLVDGEWRRIC